MNTEARQAKGTIVPMSWWRSVALLLLPVVALVGLELVLRVVLPPLPRYAIWPPGQTAIYRPSEAGTPGVSGAGRFRINSLGMRSDEPPADRKQTIYVFGCSTAIELFRDQERAWPQQIQTKLNRVPGEPKTWVGNLASPAKTALHNLLTFQYLVPDLPRPDIFLNQIGGCDLQMAIGSSYPREMTPETHMTWAFSVMPKAGDFWRRLALVRFYEGLGPVKIYGADGQIGWRKCRQEAPRENIVDALPDLTVALSQYRQNLSALVDRGNEYGAKTIFLTQPTLWSEQMGPKETELLLAGGIGPNGVWCEDHRYYSPAALASGMARFNAATLEVCRARELFCIDLANAIPKQAKYFMDELHYSDAGADLIADVVTRELLAYQGRAGTAKRGAPGSS